MSEKPHSLITAPVVCIDSGVGGLHIFKALDPLITAPLIYIADYAGFPYGDQTPKALQSRLAVLVEHIQATFQPSLIILACNTATTVAIETLRTRFPQIPFVGCIPAIKPAVLQSQSRIIGVLATPATCQQPQLNTLIAQHAQDCAVLCFPMKNLASLAECYFMNPNTFNPNTIDRELASVLNHPNAEHMDHIVLGCTHYCFLLPLLKAIGQSHWTWIDSTTAVARQAQRLWLENTPLPPKKLPAHIACSFFYTTHTNKTSQLPLLINLKPGLKHADLTEFISSTRYWTEVA